MAQARRRHLTNYWISYSDLMAGLVFVLFAITAVSNHQHRQKVSELQEKTSQLEEKTRRINDAASLRQKIAEKLQSRFALAEIPEEVATVDPQTGDIVFTEQEDAAWFRRDDDRLLPQAKKLLDRVVPIYLNVLFEDLDGLVRGQRMEDLLERIIIEGHASKEYEGRYRKDLSLSQRRAFSVAEYILDINQPQARSKVETKQRRFTKLLRKHMVAVGRSFSDARYDCNPRRKSYDARCRNDRRVVLHYSLKAEQILLELQGNGR